VAQFSSGLSGIDFSPSVDILGAQRNALDNAALSQQNQFNQASQPNRLALLDTQVTAGQIQNQYDQAAQPNKLAELTNKVQQDQITTATAQQNFAGAQTVRDSATAMAAGDPNATATALAADPVRAQAVITGTDAQNASQRARMANSFALTSSAAGSVLALPEEAQEAGYNALRPGLIAAGVSEGLLPAKYPGAAALVAHRNAALSVQDSMKLQSEYPSTNNQSPLQQGLPTGAALLFHQAHAQGVDPALVLGSAQIESGMGASPDRPGSQYKGMLQLGDQEWSANGGTPQNRDDPAMQAILGVAQLKKTQAATAAALGRAPAAWETYMAHQQGVGGLQAYLADPNRSAIDAAASTAEGQQKGRAWAQQAVIGNIPADQRAALGNNPTSGQFLNAWQQRFGRAVSQLGGGQAQPASAPGAPSVASPPSGASPPPVQMASASATNGMPAVMSDAGGGGAPQAPDNALAATMARLRANLPPPGSPGAPPQNGETTVTGPPPSATMSSPPDGSVARPSGPPLTPLPQPSASAGGIPQNTLASLVPPVGAPPIATPPNALSDLVSRYAQPQPGTPGAPAGPAAQPAQAPGEAPAGWLPLNVAGKPMMVEGQPGYQMYQNAQGQRQAFLSPGLPGVPFGRITHETADDGGINRIDGHGNVIAHTAPSTFALDTENYKNDLHTALPPIQEAGQNAQTSQIRLHQMRDLLDKFQGGAGGTTRASLVNYVESTFGDSVATDFAKKIGGISDVAAAQEFTKYGVVGAGQDVKGALGSNAGFGATKLFQTANPSLDLVNGASRTIINSRLVAAQADADFANAAAQHVVTQGGGLHHGAGYQPLAAFQQQWQQQRNPQVYAAAMGALNGQSFDKWGNGLSPAEAGRVVGILRNVDTPDTKIKWKGGQEFAIGAANATGQ